MHGGIQRPSYPRDVAILLCTMNGENFLEEQLASIAGQTVTDWKIWVSDDGSQDSTIPILEVCQHAWETNRMTIFRGPGRGFAANFLSLVVRDEIMAAYYAYADQDDVWESDKLQRALDWLAKISPDVPAMYCGRTRLISETGCDLGYSPLFTRPPCFANALVQSIAGGNTMVLNHAARMLLVEAGSHVDVVTHDWWSYLLVSGCGGVVYYDPYPTVRYRQHAANLVGSNIGWEARLSRIGMLFKGRFKAWNESHVKALQGMRHRMTKNNLHLFDGFCKIRQEGNVVARLSGFVRSGVYRQTVMGNLGLYLAAAFGRV